MSNQKSEILPRKTKILYGAGDFGFSLTDTTIGVLYAMFLTDVIGVDAGYAAYVFLVGRIWDFVNDPLMGYISDRTRSRWGRRRPFLLFGFIPFAIAYALIWIDVSQLTFFDGLANWVGSLVDGNMEKAISWVLNSSKETSS